LGSRGSFMPSIEQRRAPGREGAVMVGSFSPSLPR
jgi:hypothetical protein